MADPMSIDALVRLIRALVGVVTAIEVLGFLLNSMGFGSRNPLQQLFNPRDGGPSSLGFVPEMVIASISIVGGLAFYTLLTSLILAALLISILAFNNSFPTQTLIEASAALSILFTIILQRELRNWLDGSGALPP